MNANEITPKTNPRFKRIKNISRSLKVMLLLYLGWWIVITPGSEFISKTPDGWSIFYSNYATFAEIPWYVKTLALFCVGIYVATILTGYQLLGLYERGIIFSIGNVRLLRRIGLLATSYGALVILGGTMIFAWRLWDGTASGNIVNHLTFDLIALLISPWIIGGFFVVVIAHIMGEGCKLQEEQELTV
jgi:hypothetical protein